VHHYFDIPDEERDAVAKALYEHWLRRWWQPRFWKDYKYKGNIKLMAYLTLATIHRTREERKNRMYTVTQDEQNAAVAICSADLDQAVPSFFRSEITADAVAQLVHDILQAAGDARAATAAATPGGTP
jgi:hypothetical protein